MSIVFGFTEPIFGVFLESFSPPNDSVHHVYHILFIYVHQCLLEQRFES